MENKLPQQVEVKWILLKLDQLLAKCENKLTICQVKYWPCNNSKMSKIP